MVRGLEIFREKLLNILIDPCISLHARKKEKHAREADRHDHRI
jgi:hypothetical protein